MGITTGLADSGANNDYFRFDLTPEELENSKRIYKSATPKYDISWWIKWTASIFILASMSIRGVEGLQNYDLMLSIIGVTGWLTVGILWKDRALVLLNGVGLIIMLQTLIKGVVA